MDSNLKMYKEYLENKKSLIFESVMIDSNDESFARQGSCEFYYYDPEQLDKSKEVKRTCISFLYYLWGNLSTHDFLDGADSISGDMNLISYQLMDYYEKVIRGESIAIIDFTFNNIDIASESKQISFVLEYFSKVMDYFRKSGIQFVALQSKALLLNLSDNNRVNLVNKLLKMSFIPIGNFDNDIFFVKPL